MEVDELHSCSSQEHLRLLREQYTSLCSEASYKSEPSINALLQKVREMIREVNSTVSKATRTLTPTPGSSITSTVTNFTPSVSVPKLKVPTFSGKTTEWQPFWTVFAAIINNNVRLTPAEKTCNLITAMGSEDSQQLATRAAGATMDYDAAVAALRQRYEHKRTLFKLHFQSLFADRKTRYNHSDITQQTGLESSSAVLSLQTTS